MVSSSIIAASLDVLGKILIGVAVLRVHTRVVKEHKIDDRVIRSIIREKWWTVVGIVLILAGYIVNVSTI